MCGLGHAYRALFHYVYHLHCQAAWQFIHSFIHSFIHPSIHPSIDPFIHPFIHAPTYAPTHSPTHSLTHSFIHSLLATIFSLLCCRVCKLPKLIDNTGRMHVARYTRHLVQLAYVRQSDMDKEVSPIPVNPDRLFGTHVHRQWPVAITDSVLRTTKIGYVLSSTMIDSHSASVTA